MSDDWDDHMGYNKPMPYSPPTKIPEMRDGMFHRQEVVEAASGTYVLGMLTGAALMFIVLECFHVIAF